MLIYEEFVDKKHLVLDKSVWTHIMNKVGDKWQTFSIKRESEKSVIIRGEELSNEEAYDFYKERMASYGFRPFKILSE